MDGCNSEFLTARSKMVAIGCFGSEISNFAAIFMAVEFRSVTLTKRFIKSGAYRYAGYKIGSGFFDDLIIF